MTAALAPAAPTQTRAAGPERAAPGAAVVRREPAVDPLGPQASGQCACGGGCPDCMADAGIQPKLLVGALDDPAERDADRVADAVVGGGLAMAPAASLGAPSAPTVQRCGAIPSESCPCHGGGGHVDTIARSPTHGSIGHDHALGGGGPAPPLVGSVIGSGTGSALDPGLRATLEARFGGADFGAVRVHTDERAATSAAAISARAYTLGSDVVFGAGQYAPATSAGLHTLAHELTHVVQQQAGHGVRGPPFSPHSEPGTDSVVRRQGHGGTGRRVREVEVSCATSQIIFRGQVPYSDTTYRLTSCDVTDGDYDAGVEISGHDVTFQLGEQAAAGRQFSFTYDVDPGQVSPDTLLRNQARVRVRATAGPAAGDQDLVQVQVISTGEYEQLTGRSASELPEGRPVDGPSVLPGIGFAGARAPLPFPSNTSGLLVTPGHVTDLAAAGGDITAFGFRAPFSTHVRSWLEFRMGQYGGDATYLLNSGRAPAMFRNDWFYPYMPGAQLVHQGPIDPTVAADNAAQLRSRGGAYADQPYTFSEPPAGGAAAERLALQGAVCGPGQNCVTVPAAEHELVLGGRANPSEFATGAHPPGAIRNVTEWAEQPAEELASRGLTRTPIAAGMWARFVIKSGGRVLLIYGAYHSIDRIRNAEPGTEVVVATEEAGSWLGGYVGGVLASAGFGAALCSETGPGAVVCSVAFGILGAITGSVVGAGLVHDIGEDLQGASDILRNPAEFSRAATLMFGSQQDIRNMEEWICIDNPDQCVLDY